LPDDRNHSIQLNTSGGIGTGTGSDFDTVGMAWQYR
jgi:hypothetical protein